VADVILNLNRVGVGRLFFGWLGRPGDFCGPNFPPKKKGPGQGGARGGLLGQ